MEFKQLTNSATVDCVRAKKRPRMSEAEQDHFISLWRESGTTQTGFCQQHELNRQTFLRWLKLSKTRAELARLKPNEREPSFLSEQATCFDCQLPNGASLSLKGALETPFLLSIIKEISLCKFK